MNKVLLDKLYTDPKSSVFFASADRLFNAAKKENPKIKKTDIKEYIESNLTASLFKEPKSKFKRNVTIARSLGDYQMDLLQMPQFDLPQHNDGVNYILCVVNILSKKLYCEELKTKKNTEVRDKFLKILNRLETSMQSNFSDKGVEFTNKLMTNEYKKKSIKKFYSSDTELKAAIIERYQKTLKMKIIKFLHSTGSERYIDNLQDIVHGINSSFNRSIGTSANSITQADEYKLLRNNIWPHLLTEERSKNTLKENQSVRVRQKRKAFERNYSYKWSTRLYQIGKKINTEIPTYELRDDSKKDSKITGRYYPAELNKFTVNESTEYPIKILGYKKVKNKRMARVIFLGYEHEGEKLIPESDLTKK